MKLGKTIRLGISDREKRRQSPNQVVVRPFRVPGITPSIIQHNMSIIAP